MCSETHHNNETVYTIEESIKTQNSPADYEKAVEATGYGLFNVLLLLAVLPIAWTCIIDTTTAAFFVNSAVCDFELTMFRRGVICSIIYLGMIIAGPIWDFLLQDWVLGSLGKRNVLIIGILLDATCNILWVHATSFYTFILLKFFSGILIAGPLSVVMAYLAEFHAPSYQPKFTRWATLSVMVANIIPAALAATLMLRADWFNFSLHDYFYPTWRVYLLICAMPSVLGSVTACLIPKSPKFLIAQGKTDEALRLFRIMYCLNNFRPTSEYPITELVLQKRVKRKAVIVCREKLHDSISKLKSLFSKPHLKTILIILIIQLACMIGFNVMRLWVPPLWVMMNNFRVYTRSLYPPNELITMCEMIFPRIQNIDYTTCNYTMPSVEAAVYTNSTTIASTCVFLGFAFNLLANNKSKKISMMIFTFLIASIGCFATNWTIDIPYMLVAIAFVIVGCRITGNYVIAYNAEVMPQSLRLTALNLINFTGNLGAAAGNIIFSIILTLNCAGAFLGVAAVLLVAALMPLFLIEKPKEKINLDV